MVQAVFQHGRLIASHASLRVLEGADGGAAIKESIEHASIRGDLEHLGTALGWTALCRWMRFSAPKDRSISTSIRDSSNP